jgi:hypothetical protein
MMKAAHTSETSVDIQLRTRQYIPEDSELLPLFMFNIPWVKTIYIQGQSVETGNIHSVYRV